MEANKLKIEDFWGEALMAIEIKYDAGQNLSKNQDQEIEKIVFGFSNKSIVITPVVDTDEIAVRLVHQPVTASTKNYHESLAKHLGSKLGFVWACTNLKGYSDMYVLAFDNLHPDILILCEASELLLFETKRLKHSASPPLS